MTKCVIEGCGRQIDPVRLRRNPRTRTCSPECSEELARHYRRESAKKAMRNRSDRDRARREREAAAEPRVCVIEGCGQRIPPKRLSRYPQVRTCSSECSRKLDRHHRRESARKAMRNRSNREREQREAVRAALPGERPAEEEPEGRKCEAS